MIALFVLAFYVGVIVGVTCTVAWFVRGNDDE